MKALDYALMQLMAQIKHEEILKAFVKDMTNGDTNRTPPVAGMAQQQQPSGPAVAPVNPVPIPGG